MSGNQGLRLPPDPSGDHPTKTELWYLECLRRWIAAKRDYPVVHQLAAFCRKSPTATHSALVALEHKGFVTRVGGDGRQSRRFCPVHGATTP